MNVNLCEEKFPSNEICFDEWQKPRLVAPLKEGHIHTLFCMSSCLQASLVFALSPKFS